MITERPSLKPETLNPQAQTETVNRQQKDITIIMITIIIIIIIIMIMIMITITIMITILLQLPRCSRFTVHVNGLFLRQPLSDRRKRFRV